MKTSEKVKRARDVEMMVETPGWKLYVLPYIKENIERAGNIDSIDEKDPANSFKIQKLKRDLYRGLIYRLRDWIQEGGKNA